MVVAQKVRSRPVYRHSIPRQPLHRPRRRRGINWRPARLVSIGLLVLSLALLVVYRYGELNHLNMELRQMEATRDSLMDEQRHLELTMAKLTNLERLEKIALEELGMQYPDPGQVQYLGHVSAESGGRDGE